VVLVVIGMSAVYSVYRNGPRILPWGTPDSMRMGGEMAFL